MEFVGEIKNAAVILLVAVALLHWKSLERIRQLQKELQRENEELGRLRYIFFVGVVLFSVLLYCQVHFCSCVL